MTTTRAAALPPRRPHPAAAACGRPAAGERLPRPRRRWRSPSPEPCPPAASSSTSTATPSTLDGDELDLSPRQVELLALFLAGPRTVWSREQLHWVCWGDTSPSRRVDVQLCRLRAKTGRDLFRNVRDRGWALRPVA